MDELLIYRNISKELQIGKAGEHLVCCDLIRQGFNAFLADQGLSYDVVLDFNSKLFRIQVKTCEKPRKVQNRFVYPYTLKAAKYSKRNYEEKDLDYFAFVALDIMKIAYLPIKELINKETGQVKQIMHFKSKIMCNKNHGKYIENFSDFNKLLY